MDDWGNNYSLLQKALDVQRPLTLAIIPRLSQSRRIAEEAHRNGLGVMIHMPMQPTDMGQPMEPHTIMTTTSDANIRRYVDEALRSVPHAAGMNNHMGSAATSNTRVMRTLLNYLKTKDLFFVDSAVIAGTVGQEVARQTRIRFAKRDVFIDNELNPSAIKRQLLKAKEIALRRGQVVVIGHHKKATLKAIQEMVPEFERDGVRFVLAEDLVGKVS